VTRRKRGFLVITALLFGIVLLLLGMGFMGAQADRYRAVLRSAESAQARALCLAGLEDARMKLQNDIVFPPPMGIGQTTYSYSEPMTVGADNVPGAYSVVVETAYNVDPYWVVEITSIGSLGPPSTPIAQYQMKAELDMYPASQPPTPSRRAGHFHHLEDESSL